MRGEGDDLPHGRPGKRAVDVWVGFAAGVAVLVDNTVWNQFRVDAKKDQVGLSVKETVRRTEYLVQGGTVNKTLAGE